MNLFADTPLYLASALFAIGLFGFLVRRNLIFLFLSVEVMMLAAGYAFLTISNQIGDVDGQLMFFAILAVAAAEVCVGLAIMIRFEERNKSLNIDTADHLKG
jgi:NADH-quinone oxidoreductase subunit K